MKGAVVTRNAPDGAVHEMFGLTYASFLVLPRTLLQSMPMEWQERLKALVGEYNDHWLGIETEPTGGYRVQPLDEGGRLTPFSSLDLPHYDRGRTMVTPERTRQVEAA